ncbi:hypothetical protein U1Q18_029543, partial [Sarracenia purpurea var. burkii]
FEFFQKAKPLWPATSGFECAWSATSLLSLEATTYPSVCTQVAPGATPEHTEAT